MGRLKEKFRGKEEISSLALTSCEPQDEERRRKRRRRGGGGQGRHGRWQAEGDYNDDDKNSREAEVWVTVGEGEGGGSWGRCNVIEVKRKGRAGWSWEMIHSEAEKRHSVHNTAHSYKAAKQSRTQPSRLLYSCEAVHNSTLTVVIKLWSSLQVNAHNYYTLTAGTKAMKHSTVYALGYYKAVKQSKSQRSQL